MSQIPPLTDAYIDEIIRSAGPYVEAINKTQGVKLRELIRRLRDYFQQEIPKYTSQLQNDSGYLSAAFMNGFPIENGTRKPFLVKPLTVWEPNTVYGTGTDPIHMLLIATETINGVETVVQVKISDGVTMFKDLKNLIGGGNSPSGAISVTYNELINLIDSSSLSIGQSYIINDFQSRFREYELTYNSTTGVNTLNSTNQFYQGDIEPIIVTAIQTNKLNSVAYSTVYPDHELVYTTDNLLQQVLASTKGSILFRKDLRRNNIFSLDFVALKYLYQGNVLRAIDNDRSFNFSVLAVDTGYSTRQMIIVQYGSLNSRVFVNTPFVIDRVSDSEILSCEIIAYSLTIYSSTIKGLSNLNISYQYSYLNNVEIDADYYNSESIVEALKNFFLPTGSSFPDQNLPKPFRFITLRDSSTTPEQIKNYILSVDIATGKPIAVPLF